jgi:FkbM family methyltransferase
MTAEYTVSPPSLHSIVRNVQTFLPAPIHERRLDAQQWVNRVLRRPHEKEFHVLHGRLRPNAHVLDVGANRGQSIDSLRTAQIPGLRITAFEPQTSLAWRLMLRYPNVTVHSFGLGDRSQTLTLHTPSYRGYRYDGLASTDPAEAVGWFPYSMWRFNPDLLTLDQEEIRIMALDSLRLDRVDFIKFDVQGMEMAALRGAEGLLWRDKPLLMLETPTVDVIDWLDRLGYRPYQASGTDLVPLDGTFQVNVFFSGSSPPPAWHK